MKTKKIFSVMLCGAMFAFTACEQNPPVEEQPDGAVKIDGHYAVDLGLPSGTLWATCNIGASVPEERGNYYAWGETEPKEYYAWDNEGDYKWGVYGDNENYVMTKYNKTDGKTVLDPEDDAAQVNWCGAWRMPTWTEMEELLNTDNCTWKWTTNYNGTGVAGHIVTSVSNGNRIFLPAAGTSGFYWSSSLDPRYPYCAYALHFLPGCYSRTESGRYCGHSVRAVCSPKK